MVILWYMGQYIEDNHMQMFLQPTDHSQFLFDRVADKPDEILISSFGIYAGITYNGQDTTEWGDKYRLATRDLLETMRKIPTVRMMIGVASYRSCKGEGYCKDCELQYAKGLIRLAYHAELFPQFQWRVSTELHLKCAIFYYGDNIKGVAGGRNFTDSSWADVTFELTSKQAQELAKHTMELWDASPELNDASIGRILENQQISQKTMDCLC